MQVGKDSNKRQGRRIKEAALISGTDTNTERSDTEVGETYVSTALLHLAHIPMDKMICALN